jgi:Ca2+-binding RTX toxin-like protein
MASTSQQQEKIIELYIATFNRAPDSDGLAYWLANITDNGWGIEEVAQSMFESDEVAQTYPTGMSNSTFISNIYNNVLNREPDSAGLAYWVNQMENGLSRDVMIIAIINGANADTGSSSDQEILQNKIEVGKYFALTLGLNDLDLAKSSMEIVDGTSSSIDMAKDMQNLFVAQETEGLILIEGTSGDDLINATEDATTIYSFEGDDTIITLDGDNVVVSGAGVDSIYTQNGNDMIYARSGNDTVYSGDGDDIIYGDEGDDSLHGGDGDDLINAGDDDDYLYGDNGNDVLIAGDGNDFIYGGAGADNIYAGLGNDFIDSGDGVNFIDGGAGDDTIYAGTEDDTIYGGAGKDLIYGLAGIDTIDGLLGNDEIYGGLGNDIINGNEGDDILYGNGGDDIINGEIGNDRISGGVGADQLTGGNDADIFVFKQTESTTNSLDTILDFTMNEDMFIFVNQGLETISSSAIDISAATTLGEAVDIAVSHTDAATNAYVSWFIYEDSTYVVQDLSNDSVFNDLYDIVVKLQGIVDLTGLNSTDVYFE